MTTHGERAAMAERAARAGGEVAMAGFRGDLTVETKADKNDLVTAVDREAQARVVEVIREEFPEEPVVGEESEAAAEIPESGPAWVVDPIDGTANYVRGVRLWATAVAAVVDGEPVGSAVVQPAEGDVYAAGPGRATRNGESIAVSERSDPETFAVAPLGWWPLDERAGFVATARAVIERFGHVRRFGSLQSTLAAVAGGGLDAALTPTVPYPWDTIAGVHLVRQAGGTVTDVDGGPWRPDRRGPVVSNGRAHEAVLAAAREGLQRGP